MVIFLPCFFEDSDVAFWDCGRLVDAMPPAPSAEGEFRNVYRVERRVAVVEVPWWLVV